MTLLFMQWLYLDAPKAYLRYAKEVTLSLYNYFSISLLISTLTSPWRQDAIALSRLPVRMWGQALLSNGTSRMIGIIVRLTVILTGSMAISVYTLGVILFFIAWYTLPILLIASVIYGIRLILGGV